MSPASAIRKVSLSSLNTLRRRRIDSSVFSDTRLTNSSKHINHSFSAPKSLIVEQTTKLSSVLASLGGSSSRSYAQDRAQRQKKYIDESDMFMAGYIPENEVTMTYFPSNESSANIYATNQKKKYKSDLVVVLDMDECLIHSQFLSHTSMEYRQQEDRSQSSLHSSKSQLSVDCFHMELENGEAIHVNKRPRLDDFLASITSRYETHVFTAAMEVYASPLLDKLDPDGTMFSKRFYRDSCTFDSSLGVYVKDLSKILTSDEINGFHSDRVNYDGLLQQVNDSFNEKRVVLVDNNPYSFIANPSNGILVSNFYDDPKDDTLGAVMELLVELEQHEDVRPVLESKFGLKDALNDIEQDASGWR